MSNKGGLRGSHGNSVTLFAAIASRKVSCDGKKTKILARHHFSGLLAAHSPHPHEPSASNARDRRPSIRRAAQLPPLTCMSQPSGRRRVLVSGHVGGHMVRSAGVVIVQHGDGEQVDNLISLLQSAMDS